MLSKQRFLLWEREGGLCLQCCLGLLRNGVKQGFSPLQFNNIGVFAFSTETLPFFPSWRRRDGRSLHQEVTRSLRSLSEQTLLESVILIDALSLFEGKGLDSFHSFLQLLSYNYKVVFQ